MRISKWFLIVGWIAAGGACVEPYPAPVIDNAPKLVVDGLITDAPGPHTINLFMSSRVDEDLAHPNQVSQAVVKIIDDLGTELLLTEQSPGEYVTDDDVQGVVGRKYKLEVVLADGEKYQSSFEELRPSGQIEQVYFEFEANSINKNDPTLPQDAFWVYLDAKGVANEKNLLRWRWTGTFQSHSNPETRVKYVDNVPVPDPIPCSGYIAPDGILQQIKPCTCCDCWAPFYNRDVLVSNNDFVAAADFDKILLGKIAVDRAYFYDKFHIAVQQLTLSDESYDFWKLLSESKNGAGNIFQPNAVQIRGNMHCVTNEDEEVYGVFSAASLAHNDVFIHRADIPYGIGDPDSLAIDCQELYVGSTNQKPPFW